MKVTKIAGELFTFIGNKVVKLKKRNGQKTEKELEKEKKFLQKAKRRRPGNFFKKQNRDNVKLENVSRKRKINLDEPPKAKKRKPNPSSEKNRMLKKNAVVFSSDSEDSDDDQLNAARSRALKKKKPTPRKKKKTRNLKSQKHKTQIQMLHLSSKNSSHATYLPYFLENKVAFCQTKVDYCYILHPADKARKQFSLKDVTGKVHKAKKFSDLMRIPALKRDLFVIFKRNPTKIKAPANVIEIRLFYEQNGKKYVYTNLKTKIERSQLGCDFEKVLEIMLQKTADPRKIHFLSKNGTEASSKDYWGTKKLGFSAQFKIKDWISLCVKGETKKRKYIDTLPSLGVMNGLQREKRHEKDVKRKMEKNAQTKKTKKLEIKFAFESKLRAFEENWGPKMKIATMPTVYDGKKLQLKLAIKTENGEQLKGQNDVNLEYIRKESRCEVAVFTKVCGGYQTIKVIGTQDKILKSLDFLTSLLKTITIKPKPRNVLEGIVTVAGAGIQESNGVYKLNGERNGKPCWSNEETGHSIYWYHVVERWYLADPRAKFLYKNEQGSDAPAARGWVKTEFGTLPCPKITLSVKQQKSVKSEKLKLNSSVFDPKTVFTVKDAGVKEANGTYEYIEKFNQRARCANKKSGFSILWDSCWYCADSNGKNIYQNREDTDQPKANGWTKTEYVSTNQLLKFPCHTVPTIICKIKQAKGVFVVEGAGVKEANGIERSPLKRKHSEELSSKKKAKLERVPQQLGLWPPHVTAEPMAPAKPRVKKEAVKLEGVKSEKPLIDLKREEERRNECVGRCLCKSCGEKNPGRCPICRVEIQRIQRIYDG